MNNKTPTRKRSTAQDTQKILIYFPDILPPLKTFKLQRKAHSIFKKKDFFVKLLSVSGVGPKAAIAILGVATVSDLKFAILSDDEKVITAAPGVGPKLAKRIILDLKERIDIGDTFEQAISTPAASGAVFDDVRGDCLQALVALGYSSSEVLKAMNLVEGASDMDVEQLLKETLKHL